MRLSEALVRLELRRPKLIHAQVRIRQQTNKGHSAVREQMRLDPNRMPSGIIADGEIRVPPLAVSKLCTIATSGPFLLEQTVLMVIEGSP